MSDNPTFVFSSENLGTVALAIGALGTASYGVVDGFFKSFTWFDSAGFERIFAVGGKEGGRRWPIAYKATLDPLLPALRIAYGADVMELLRAQYRGGRVSGDLPRTLRQGVRIGFGMMELRAIESVAVELGIKEEIAFLAAQAIEQARRQRSRVEQSTSQDESTRSQELAMTDEQRSAMARLETMIDARIDAALALADTQYVAQTKLLAMAVSLVIAIVLGQCTELKVNLVWCWIVGLAAVPLAPVAKDLSTALQEAVKALKAR